MKHGLLLYNRFLQYAAIESHKRNSMKAFILVIFFLFQILIGYSQTIDSTKTDQKIAPWFVERFKISAGFFYPVNNTSIQVGITGKPGTEIDLETDLGFNAKTGILMTDFQWRASRRSRFNFGYYNIKRSSDYVLQKDITFDSITYHTNASVHSFFNTAIYQFSYGYAIVAKSKFELGLRLGFHIVGVEAGIALNSTSMNLSKSTNYQITAPLPDLGIWGGYAFSNRLAANLEVEYLSLSVNGISGSIMSYNLSVLYKVTDRLNLSLGYSGLDFSVNADGNKANGHFKWGYNGPALAATFSFGKKSWIH